MSTDLYVEGGLEPDVDGVAGVGGDQPLAIQVIRVETSN